MKDQQVVKINSVSEWTEILSEQLIWGQLYSLRVRCLLSNGQNAWSLIASAYLIVKLV